MAESIDPIGVAHSGSASVRSLYKAESDSAEVPRLKPWVNWAEPLCGSSRREAEGSLSRCPPLFTKRGSANRGRHTDAPARSGLAFVDKRASWRLQSFNPMQAELWRSAAWGGTVLTSPRPHRGRTYSAVISSATSTEADAFRPSPPTAKAAGYSATAPRGWHLQQIVAPYIHKPNAIFLADTNNKN